MKLDMTKKILLIGMAVLCVIVSNKPAMAVYSGITDTVENVIHVLAKENGRSVVYQVKVSTPGNAQVKEECSIGNMVFQQNTISTASNADEQVQTYTNSDAEKLS